MKFRLGTHSRGIFAGLFMLAAAPAFAQESAPAVEPSLIWALPFAALLACIAIFPLAPALSAWWEHNRNKLLVSAGLALLTCLYVALRGYGFAGSAPGLPAVFSVFHHAVISDYLPFVILLFSLYSISGGVRLTGDLPAHPWTNCAFLLVGAVLASFIGTTGAAMLLIRPLLQVNRERQYVKHTVVFFIFLVCNIGGSLLPIGDPPLFLGYLRGVPFLWTLHAIGPWMFSVALVLAIYFVMDTLAYRKETPAAIQLDETQIAPLRMRGRRNLFFLAGVVLAVAVLVPGTSLPGTGLVVPPYLREVVLLALAGASLALTPKIIHAENHFNFGAIQEVACLFIGLFITMQVPMEILKAAGDSLAINTPAKFFWLSGMLSSFLDNAPTYAVFFELAGATHPPGAELLHNVSTATGSIAVKELLAISCGSVFMGANSYIGNGPNFLVKSIADHHGVKMPSFFGYMVYSGAILIPTFILVTFVFF